jgi:hypothetical protein
VVAVHQRVSGDDLGAARHNRDDWQRADDGQELGVPDGVVAKGAVQQVQDRIPRAAAAIEVRGAQHACCTLPIALERSV